MSNEMISVIVPTYNREEQIERAVRSILQQTFDRYEIIIVDDGSTDRTEEVVRGISDDRLQYIRLDHNHGAAYARNVGIRASQYKYIAFLDSDDEWHPRKLELQMRRMQEESPEVGLVYCRMSGMQEDGRGRQYTPAYECRPESLEGDMFHFLLWRNVIGTPAMLVRRECLESVGLFRESLSCLEDYELVLRIAEKWRISFVNEVLVEIHRTSGSLTSRIAEQLVVRCYLVSRYRQKMTAFGILELVEEETLHLARQCGIEEEIKELLHRDFIL